MSELDILTDNLKALKLNSFIDGLSELTDKELSDNLISTLLRISYNEINQRQLTAQQTILKTSGMAMVKKIEEFDFSFNTSIAEKKN